MTNEFQRPPRCDDPLGGVDARLLVEGRDVERRAGRIEAYRLSGFDVAEPGSGRSGCIPSSTSLSGSRRTSLNGALEMGDEGPLVPDVMIAREDGDDGVRIAPCQVEEAPEQPRAGVAVAGWTSTLSGGSARSCVAGDGQVRAVDDDERALGRDERRDPRERLFEERPVPGDAAVLLRDGLAGERPGQVLEAGPITARQHESPEPARSAVHLMRLRATGVPLASSPPTERPIRRMRTRPEPLSRGCE